MSRGYKWVKYKVEAQPPVSLAPALVSLLTVHKGHVEKLSDQLVLLLGWGELRGQGKEAGSLVYCPEGDSGMCASLLSCCSELTV